MTSSLISWTLVRFPSYAISWARVCIGGAISVRRVLAVWILARSLLLRVFSLDMVSSGVFGRAPVDLGEKGKAVPKFCDWVLILPGEYFRWLCSLWLAGGPRCILDP